MIVATFILVLIGCIVLGIPVAWSLIAAAIALMLKIDFFNAQIVAQNMIHGTDNFILLAIPFFILAGELMNRGGLSRHIIEVAMALFGHVRGGLGYVGIVAALIMASLSGSAIADSAALAAILVPMMRMAGYPEGKSGGLLAAGGVIAPILPPSIALVVFGAIANISITGLFMASIVPGLLMAAALAAVWGFHARNKQYETFDKPDRRTLWRIIGKGLPALVLPFIIIGGMRLGIFTPTEASVIAVAYATIVGALVYRELDIKGFYGALVESGKTAAVVMFLVGASMISAWLVSIANLPAEIVEALAPLMDSPRLLLAAILILTLLLGMVLDFTPLMLILMPIMIPLCQAAHIDLTYFGVVFIMAGALGMLTPPVGNVLNVVAGVARIRIDRIITGVMPFLVAEIIILALLVLFPALVMVPFSWLH
ncbi:TRAP transporter large permease [Salinicola rhizosphaerae]|uniref:TRAP transporter large permease protein n=1 Tax=Salinicola rhizosphaerae TaxID=1443141 RepID=A0ABQ3DZP5_9GAMM|nr:TRAP transporter large permease subunit [Salinicola rhizosphaerae]GHB21526.1 dehydroascorbate transporter [Salinicola rhizosphaerae]